MTMFAGGGDGSPASSEDEDGTYKFDPSASHGRGQAGKGRGSGRGAVGRSLEGKGGASSFVAPSMWAGDGERLGLSAYLEKMAIGEGSRVGRDERRDRHCAGDGVECREGEGDASRPLSRKAFRAARAAAEEAAAASEQERPAQSNRLRLTARVNVELTLHWEGFER